MLLVIGMVVVIFFVVAEKESVPYYGEMAYDGSHDGTTVAVNGLF